MINYALSYINIKQYVSAASATIIRVPLQEYLVNINL